MVVLLHVLELLNAIRMCNLSQSHLYPSSFRFDKSNLGRKVYRESWFCWNAKGYVDEGH